MQLALIFFVVLSLVELGLWLPPIWKFRRYLAPGLMPALSIVSGFLLVNYFSVSTVLICLLTAYRIVNLLRIVQNRTQADYLYHASRRTTLWLLGLQLAVYFLARLVDYNNFSLITGLHLLALGQLSVCAVLMASARRNLHKTFAPDKGHAYATKDLPTVTVAIPARNETTDLEDCLNSLVSSSYPKLEILVLDDCSQNKRTPDIIRQFAQSGVRFVAGQPPPDQWLAKNYAYHQLAKQASGELILFCGVDTRFKPDTIDWMVRTLLDRKKSMLCAIPRNQLFDRASLRQLLIQPARYAWELAPPRRLLNRPPVLSTCWLIKRGALEAAGGFAAVSRKAVPESYFARQTALNNDGYTLVRGSSKYDVSSAKQPGEQLQTALRTRYPQLHRRPELVAVVGGLEFTTLVWPLPMLAIALVSSLWPLAALSGLAYLLATLTYVQVSNLTYHRRLWRAWLIMPLSALYDIWILHASMWQYEFGEVIWKGRNVCIPVMRANPALPKLP